MEADLGQLTLIFYLIDERELSGPDLDRVMRWVDGDEITSRLLTAEDIISILQKKPMKR